MIWLSISLAAFGFVLLVVGSPRLLRRREGNAQTCALCDYDLTGLTGKDAPSAVCPECGSDLNASGAVLKGRRKTRGRTEKTAALLGAITLIAGIGLGGTQAWHWSQAYDWNKVKPVWLLHSQAKKSTATSGVAVLDELLKRIVAGKLSQSDAQPIIETVLARQADLATTWNQQWGDFMVGAIEQSFVTDEQLEQYIGNVVILSSAVRPKLYPGEAVPGSFVVAEMRCGGKERYRSKIKLKEAKIGQKPLDYKHLGGGLDAGLAAWSWNTDRSWLLGGGDGMGNNFHRYFRDLPESAYATRVTAPEELGPTQVHLTWSIATERGKRGDMRIDGEQDRIGVGIEAQTEQHFVHDVEIVAPGTHAIKTRPGNDGIVVTHEEARLERYNDGNASARGQLILTNLDATAGYDIIWILPEEVAKAWQTDREWVVSRRVIANTSRSTGATLPYASESITLPKGKLDEGWLEDVQIVLRPSALITRMTVDIWEIPADSTDLGTYRVKVVDKRRR